LIVLKISGDKAFKVFQHESGGHRWQRVPPTEKRGRVHTSTITVAVMQEVVQKDFVLNEKDLQITTCRAGGAGGQKVNKTSSAVQVKHIPSGLLVRCETQRSQSQNKETALQILCARLAQQSNDKLQNEMSANRKSQVGSGMRGDKRRTVRQQDGQVNDHLTGRTWRYEDYVKGNW